MAELHVNINGDCSGLIAATDRANSAIDSLANKTAVARVELVGVDAAASGMAAVAAARENAGGTVTLGADVSAIAAGRQELGGLRNDMRAANREFEAASGLRSFGFTDNGSVRQLTVDLGGVTRGLQSVGVESGSLNRLGSAAQGASRDVSGVGSSMSAADRSASSFGGTVGGAAAALRGYSQASSAATAASVDAVAATRNLESGMGGVEAAASSAIAPMRQASMVMAGGGSGNAIAESATGGSTAVKLLDRDLESVGSTATQTARQLGTVSDAIGGGGALRNAGAGIGSAVPGSGTGGTSGGFHGSGLAPLGTPGTGHGPPSPPRVPPGIAGLGGGGGFAAAGSEFDASAGAGAFEGAMGLAGPLMMGGLVGVAAAAVTAAVGAGSVMETVKHLPGAMSAATQATNQFGKALTNTVAGASVDKSAFNDLGQALHGLGSEVGTIGLQNMDATIGGVASVVGTATAALKTMEPAITPSINAMTALGNAVINGIASPGVVSGILGVDRALSDPSNEKGISSLISGALQVATIVGQVAVDVAGSVGSVVSNVAGVVSSVTGAAGLAGISPDAALPSVLTGGVAAMVGGAKGGMSGAALWGGVAAAVTGLAQFQVDQGQSPLDALSAGFSSGVLAKSLGAKTPAAAGIGLAADAITTALAQIPGQGGVDASNMMADVANFAEAGAIFGTMFGPEGTAIGAAGGGLIGAGKGIYDAMYPSAGGGAAGTASAQPGPGQFPGRAGMDAANQAAQAAQQKAAQPGASDADKAAAVKATAAAQQTDQATTGGKYGWNMDSAGTLSPSNSPGGGGGWYPGGPGTGGSGVQSVQPPGMAMDPLAGSSRIAGSDSSTLPAGMGAPVGATIPTGPGFGDLSGLGSFGQSKTLPPPSAGGAAAPPAPFSTTGGAPAAVAPLSGGAAVLPPGSPLNAGVGAAGTPGAGTLPPPPKPVTTAPMGGGQGAGTSFGSLNPAQVAGLNAVLPPTAANLARMGPAAQQMSAGLQTAAPAATSLSAGLAKVQQSASAVSAPVQQAGQHAAAATSQMQTMQQAAPAVASAVKAVAPAATAALNQAATQVAAAAPAVGAAAPAGIAAGVTANTSQACDASSQMAKSMQNCASAQLGHASPSKAFILIGESTGQGLAIGVTNSMPSAVTAIQSAMGNIVSAGKAGLAASSPSKEFQSMGSQAMDNVAGGAHDYAPGSNARYPMADNAARDAESQRAQDEKNSPAQREHDASTKELQHRGFSDKQIQRIQDQQKEHNDRQKALTAGRDDAQRKAMEAAGYKGYDPTNPASAHDQYAQQLAFKRQQTEYGDLSKVDPSSGKGFDAQGHPANPFSPHATNPAQALQAAKDRAAIARQASLEGKTPNQVMDDNRDARAGAPKPPPGPGPGFAGQGHKGAGPGAPGLGGDMNAMGKDAVQGFTDGIHANAAGPPNAMGKIADGVIAKPKATLGIKSPSQEFHGVGEDTMRGWSQGVEGGRGGLNKQFDDMSHDMRDRWDKDNEWFRNNPLGLGVNPSGGGGGGGSSGGSSGGGGNLAAAMSGGPGSGIVEHGQYYRAEYENGIREIEPGPSGDKGGYSLSGPGGIPHFSQPKYDGLVETNTAQIAQEVKAYSAAVNAALKPIDTALVGGFGSGVTAASNGVLPIASSTGLLVGTVWARSVTTGADSVLTLANFGQLSMPQIGSALAKTALGKAGLLGPAGSGAAVAKAPPVTMSTTATTAAAVPAVTLNVSLDGQVFKQYTADQINQAFSNLANSIGAQRG